MKGFKNLLVKSDPGNLNRQDERNPCAAAASIKNARMVGAFTIINKVSENQSLIKCRSDQVKKNKCSLLKTVGAKCFYATRTHLPKLRLH